VSTQTQTKETAFYPRLSALTDQWMDLFGYWAPTVVTDTLDEYRAVRETAGLMDFSMLRKIDIDGPGAQEYVNTIVARDVAKLSPGRIAYGPLTDEDGKMVDDCTVMVRGPDRIRFCGANDADQEIFREHAPEGVSVREFTDAMPHLCLQGPKSREMLQPLASQDLSNEAFPYYTFREDVEIAGIPVFMTRLGYTAELGYELWVEEGHALELWDALVEATEPQGMKVVGMVALDLFRIEGGFIIGGIEYDPTVSPYECGLGWAVELDKQADFRGKEGLARDRDGTQLRLTSVVLESGGDEASGAPLFVEGEEVGVLTQAVESPHLEGRTLGLAKIQEPLNEPGRKVEARIGETRVGGEVVAHPAYEPDRRKAKTS
jgi:glycine cleavage system T protein (aminomethyltransferase)